MSSILLIDCCSHNENQLFKNANPTSTESIRNTQYKDILHKYNITTVDYLNENCTETIHKTKTFTTIKEVYFNQQKNPYICIFLCNDKNIKYVLDKYLQRLLLPNGMFAFVPDTLSTITQINDVLHRMSYNKYKEFLLHFYIKKKNERVFHCKTVYCLRRRNVYRNKQNVYT